MACNFQCVWMKLILFHYFHSRIFWMSRFDFWLILFDLSLVDPHIFHPVIYRILIILSILYIPFTFHNNPKNLILRIIQQWHTEKCATFISVKIVPFGYIWYCIKVLEISSLILNKWWFTSEDSTSKWLKIRTIGNREQVRNFFFPKPLQISNEKYCQFWKLTSKGMVLVKSLLAGVARVLLNGPIAAWQQLSKSHQIRLQV